MDAVKKAMDIQKSSKEKGSVINGIYLEGPFLNPSKCGALDASSFLEPDEMLFMQLIVGYEDIIKIITVAPELNGALELIKKYQMGIIVSMGHSDATYAQAEAGYHSGARGITHLSNAMRGIHHREPGIAGFGLMNRDVYVELIADPFHLDQRIVDHIFTLKNLTGSLSSLTLLKIR
jgi:N-acetylglucosamine-6-phosphate deacetylase